MFFAAMGHSFAKQDNFFSLNPTLSGRVSHQKSVRLFPEFNRNVRYLTDTSSALDVASGQFDRTFEEWPLE